ncbi:hypothetical protein [Aestuariibaculum suncheonense]|uniref:Uncharacterized protein n=1 Tax=Aestuariibaculum suncheonense TaxID=1028745 RepID=A0A8J6QCE8_9FLAO|nr:hypothetical protein [Aestuariibaculum suncheonense]MBD0834858.1 hypothetical protein [Aestuariibaculum suncheonense]
MRSKNALKMAFSLCAAVILCFVSIKSFAHKTTPSKLISKSIYQQSDVIVTLDKTTSEKDFEDIKSMLKDNGITANFRNIERNEINEITGIKIELKTGNNESAISNFSSSSPISEITFGRKDGSLFISQGSLNQNTLGFSNRPNMHMFSFGNDSIPGMNLKNFGGFNLNDFFNSENGSFFFNGQNIDMDKLRKQLEEQFDSEAFSSLFNPEHGKSNQFQFIDDPNTNKLIIIDGKESDFDTLDKLAKENKLKAVDHLKSKTAMSIYGDKAKDGAVIATTK